MGKVKDMPSKKYRKAAKAYYEKHINNPSRGEPTNKHKKKLTRENKKHSKKKGVYLGSGMTPKDIEDALKSMWSTPVGIYRQMHWIGGPISLSSIRTGGSLYDILMRGDSYKTEEKLTQQQEKIKTDIMQLKQVLGEKFINVDEIAEILEIGFISNKNVFLYGRGGHAKSEIVQEFLKYIDPDGRESFVQACGEGLSEEKLFGGLNLKKFQETGEIEYLVENSFMNKRYVVFEELLDSRMNVLLSLKDILTSGTFRQGSQQFKIKTEFVICLTNRTKQEVAEDNSIKALLERFPLEMKVEWNRYEANDYKNMFSKVLGDQLEKVATICQSINESGDFVSPRTAIHMGQVYQKTGSLISLKYFGATGDIIEKVERVEKERLQTDYLSKKLKEYEVLVASFGCTTIDQYKVAIKKIKAFLIEVGATKYTEKVFPTFASMKTAGEKLISDYKAEMFKILEND